VEEENREEVTNLDSPAIKAGSNGGFAVGDGCLGSW